MSESAGSQSKMGALKTAAKLFVDLARAGHGDRIGIADFDHVATLDLPLTPVSDAAPSSRVAARDAIDALAPRGATSIGAGMEQARTAFAAAGGTARQAMVVVTDGMENTAPFVKGGPPTAPRIDLSQYAGVTIYTVGLGLGSEVDLGVLASLASTFRGSFYLTEDRWLSLPKFFIEIFCDTIDEFVTLDPEFELVGANPWESDLDLAASDHVVTIAAYWQDAAVALRLELVAPNGTVVDAASAAADPRIRFVHAPGYTFFRLPLPLAATFGRAWAGKWRVRASAALGRGQRLAFGVSAIVASSLGIECELLRKNDATGQAPILEVRLSEAGRLIKPDEISVRLEAPVYSRGELLASVGPQPKSKASADYGEPAIRDRLAWGVANDRRFRERRIREVDATVEKSPRGPVMRAQLPVTAVEGAYHYRVVAHCRRGALTLRRECAHSFIALAYPDADRTETRVQATTEPDRHRMTVVPRDAVDNRLGPGLAAEMSVKAANARATPLEDAGDGSYALDLVAPAGAESQISVSIALRGVKLVWDWAELAGKRKPRNAKAERPHADPAA